MTEYDIKAQAHGITAVLRADTTTLTLTRPEWGAHVRSNVSSDTQGWVQIPVPLQLDGKFKLKKVEVLYATGWKTIFDAIQIHMGQTKILDKNDFGLSHDKVTKVEFDGPGSEIDQGIAISLLFTIPGGRDVHGRWATVSSVAAYLSRV